MQAENNQSNRTNRHTSYIQVDSSQRRKLTENIYGQLYSLPPYPLEFTNGSSIIKIHFPNHPLQLGDKIVLNNVVSKNVMLNNPIMVKKGSYYVRIFHPNHGLSLFGLYDSQDPNQFTKINYVDRLPQAFGESDDIPDIHNQYYILRNNLKSNLKVQLSNIKGTDPTRSLIGNIPANYLNSVHLVYLIFLMNGQTFYADPDSYLIILDKKSSINYLDSNATPNNVYIKFHNLYGIPLNHLNSGKTSMDENATNPLFQTVGSISPNTFTIDVKYPAIVDPFTHFYIHNDITNQDIRLETVLNSNRGGGNQVYVRSVTEILPGDPNPNSYTCNLEREYRNVVQARIIASIFPNAQRVVNNNPADVINNKLYWRNLDDGDCIYQLSIEPGNYAPKQLAMAIENAFNRTIRYRYTLEYQSEIAPVVIQTLTPIDNQIYDENGINKYHNVKVEISEATDIVAFTSFRELSGKATVSVPDVLVQFTTAADLRAPNSFIPHYASFDPNVDTLFIYPTANTHIRIDEQFPHIYNNLYKFIHYLDDHTFTAQLDDYRAILINFHRIKQVYPLTESTNELRTINTNTQFEEFYYDYLMKQVNLLNHNLKVGDIIITDKFVDPVDPDTVAEIFVYEIENIIDDNHFAVRKYRCGEKYKFIYDGIIINFISDPNEDPVYWLDQISSEDEPTNNTLSMVAIAPLPMNKRILRVYHPNHELQPLDAITISNSGPINQVPSTAINGKHLINKIVDGDTYVVLLDNYVQANGTHATAIENLVTIKYPTKFQLLFNYNDTIGQLLNFDKVGDPLAITPYRHTITNTDPYANDNTYKQPVKKLDMIGQSYFYISCPELTTTISNTKPVPNVFAIIRYFSNPGTIVFDSFVPATKYFNTPVARLSQLHFQMYYPNGRLVDFNGLDHSFVIELIELIEQYGGL